MKREEKMEKMEKTDSKTGLKDPGNFKDACDYVHGCRTAEKDMYYMPPKGPVTEPSLLNGVPAPKERNVK